MVIAVLRRLLFGADGLIFTWLGRRVWSESES